MNQKIIVRTNVDRYKNCFPSNLSYVPRIGETVSVENSFIKEFHNKKRPSCMTVVDVTYYNNEVIIEVHFRDIDFKFAELNKINLFD